MVLRHEEIAQPADLWWTRWRVGKMLVLSARRVSSTKEEIMRISIIALVVAIIAVIGVIWTGIQNRALVEDVENQIRDVQLQVRLVEAQAAKLQGEAGMGDTSIYDTINKINAQITRLQKDVKCIASPGCFLTPESVRDY